jgi:putative phage-type endonuclease
MQAIKLDIEQGSPEWLTLRRTKITATDAPVIMRASEYETPAQLWRRKLSGEERPETEAMRQGRELEPLLRRQATEMLGIELAPAVVVAKRRPWQMASLDGFNETDGVAVEIKTTSSAAIMHARSADEALAAMPKSWLWQVLHQRDVLGLDRDRVSYLFVAHREKDVILDRVELRMLPIMIVESSVTTLMATRLPCSGHPALRLSLSFDRVEMRAREKSFLHCIETRELSDAFRDTIEMQDATWASLAEEYRDAMRAKREAEERVTQLRRELERLALLKAGERDTQALAVEGAGVRVSWYYRRGAIDYSAIPELKGLDLEPYRKRGSLVTRIDVKDEEA